MKTRKPMVHFVKTLGHFTRNGQRITDEEARQHWEAVNVEWTMTAYNEMAKRTAGKEAA